MAIFISIGHGSHGKDPGAVANSTTEYNECLSIMHELQKISSGFILVPVNLTLVERIRWVKQNTSIADHLIELHMNSANGADGADIFYKAGDRDAGIFAQKILKRYSFESKVRERSVTGDTSSRHGRLGIIRDVPCTAFLLEMGFVSNIEDIKKVRDGAAKALAEVLLALFGLPFTYPHNQKVAEWAEQSFLKAEKKGFTRDAPEDQIGTNRMRKFLIKAGFDIADDDKKGVNYQELIHTFAKKGLFD